MNTAAWDNTIEAMLHTEFVKDLGIGVGNDRHPDNGSRYLITLASDFLRKREQPCGPIAAFDFAAYDFEGVGKYWVLMQEAARIHDAEDHLPTLARFVADRFPAVWSERHLTSFSDLTRIVRLADRADTLVSLFKIGLKPNGSKDPFALRRAAKEFIGGCEICPITVGKA